MTSLIGQSIGRYKIIEQLGEGGMATVYKAFDTRLERNVAIKLIRHGAFAPEQLEGILQRFDREAKALARLTHPNIVRVIDYGDYEGSPYLIMEFLQGGTLKLLMGKSMPWQEAFRMVLPIAHALQYAHEHNIVHRDIKPSNILLTEKGQQPMLSDFGIAKILEDGAAANLTGTGMGIGTPEYMAPEQWTGQGGPQSDLYSLGVVLYELVTGRNPYTANTPAAILLKQANEPLPRPGQFAPGLPEPVEKVLLKVLEKDPANRYQSMDDFSSALEGLLVQDAGKAQSPDSSTQVGSLKVESFPEVEQTLVLNKSKPEEFDQTLRMRPPVIPQQPPVSPPAKSRTTSRRWLGWAIGGGAAVILLGFGLLVFLLIRLNVIPTSRVVLPPEPAHTGPVTIRWSTWTGEDSNAVEIQNEVVADFNKSQNEIILVIEALSETSVQETILSEMAAGKGPDIVGPDSWFAASSYGDIWLDLAPYIAYTRYNTKKFEDPLTRMYQTDQGTLGLPFIVYPSAIYYNVALFQKAGLNPPPAKYGEKYKMPDGSMVDWNWDTLKTVAKLLTIDSAGKHSGEAGFDVNNIVQFGFSFGWEFCPNYWSAYMSNGGQMLVPGGSKGSYAARIPETWKTAWKWVHDGILSAEPYILINASVPVFASGKVAMVESPSWYLDENEITKAGIQFDFGAMPIGLDGRVAGRVDGDTFRIWKGSIYPLEAFKVLTYLMDTGSKKLLIGTPDRPPAYGSLPGQTSLRGSWLNTQKAAYPFVQNWDVLLAGLNYPDIPSAEGFMPNMNESWNRIQNFGNLLVTTRDVDLPAEEARLESDLTTIFNK